MTADPAPADAPVPPGGDPVMTFRTQKAWTTWLAAHHTQTGGLWLHLAKKGAPTPTVTYDEAVESALCFGWIDGQKRRFDDHTYLQRFSPRRRASVWSQINRDKATALIDQGRMQPAGQLEVDRARGDGRWDAAYAGQRDITVPDDLQAALDASPAAAVAFAALNGTNRFAILFRVTTAVRPETRARRIATSVAMLERGETYH